MVNPAGSFDQRGFLFRIQCKCNYLVLRKMLEPKALANLVDHALAEDVGDGDHSTLAVIPPDTQGHAILKIKEDGVLAGMEVAEFIFNYLEPGSSFFPKKRDGDLIRNGEIAFEVEAHVHVIL